MSSFYVDYENVHLSGLTGIESLHKSDQVIVYCRDEDVLRIKCFVLDRKIKAKVLCRIVSASTKNALDFQMITELSLFEKKNHLIFIISNDHGYDASIKTLQENSHFVFRKSAIDADFNFDCSNIGKLPQSYSIN